MPKLSQDLFYAEIGKRIKDFREKADISQETLAIALQLTRASVINIEKGRHKPSLFQLLEIADILKVSLTSLIPQMEIHSRNDKQYLSNIDLKNAVTDQEKIDKLTEATVLKFIQSLHH